MPGRTRALAVAIVVVGGAACSGPRAQGSGAAPPAAAGAPGAPGPSASPAPATPERHADARPGHVRARAVGDDGSPLAGIRVRHLPLIDLGFGDPAERTGADGRVSFPIPRDGPLRLELRAEGRAPRVVTVDVRRGVDVDLGDVVLATGRQVAGQVVDADTGAPVRAAQVSWTVPGADSGSDAPAQTDDAGRFELGHVGDPAELHVELPGYAAATLPAPAGGAVTVRLGRGGAVEIRVLSASGAPRAGAEVVLNRGAGTRSRAGRTDADGRLVASALAPGSWFVEARVDAAPANPGLSARVVEVRAGERATLELRERSAGTTLAVTLVGPGAAEGEELHVALMRGALPAGELRLSALGAPIEPARGSPRRTPRFELLEPGRYTFLVAKPDGDTLRVLVRPVEVGEGPREALTVEVPAELPRGVW